MNIPSSSHWKPNCTFHEPTICWSGLRETYDPMVNSVFLWVKLLNQVSYPTNQYFFYPSNHSQWKKNLEIPTQIFYKESIFIFPDTEEVVFHFATINFHHLDRKIMELIKKVKRCTKNEGQPPELMLEQQPELVSEKDMRKEEIAYLPFSSGDFDCSSFSLFSLLYQSKVSFMFYRRKTLCFWFHSKSLIIEIIVLIYLHLTILSSNKVPHLSLPRKNPSTPNIENLHFIPRNT